MTESGEMRAMRMIARHGSAVVSSSTSEPGELGTSRKNAGYPTVAVQALTYVRECLRWSTMGSRRVVQLNAAGREWCTARGIDLSGDFFAIDATHQETTP